MKGGLCQAEKDGGGGGGGIMSCRESQCDYVEKDMGIMICGERQWDYIM